jgi:hypothetical protein
MQTMSHMQRCSDSSMDDKDAFCASPALASVQIPLWTIRTTFHAMTDSGASSDSSMDDKDLQAIITWHIC